jgi:translation initiation factor 2B subunit (eIF-2B alpha/beta/delta family)
MTEMCCFAVKRCEPVLHRTTYRVTDLAIISSQLTFAARRNIVQQSKLKMADMGNIRSLEDGIQLLKDDHTNGARVLATNALRTLGVVMSNKTNESPSAKQLWNQCRVAGYKLTLARPSMGAAITSAVVHGLRTIRQNWEKELGTNWLEAADSSSSEKMKQVAYQALNAQIESREHSGSRLANAFVDYLRQNAAVQQGQVSILTLSSSSSLTACLGQAVRALPNIKISLSVLESRPMMEGATFAVTIMNSLSEGNGVNNVKMVAAPDTHVCVLAKTADILLIGADRVSGEGDISNKMGSLAAAMAIKTLSNGNVVVVTEKDKIARPGSLEEHKEEDNDPDEVVSRWPQNTRALLMSQGEDKIKIRNTYFEWVPRCYVDTYVTEDGLLSADKIKGISQAKAMLEDELFDKDIVELAQRT